MLATLLMSVSSHRLPDVDTLAARSLTTSGDRAAFDGDFVALLARELRHSGAQKVTKCRLDRMQQ